jgi:hypothetical protein
MDRDSLFGSDVDTSPHLGPLAWDDALRLAKTNRGALAGYLAARERCPLAKRMPRKVGRFLYRAAVVDERTGEEVAKVRSLTRSGGEKRLDRAFGRELHKLHDAQAAEKQMEATS